jgi:hypothetical protein
MMRSVSSGSDDTGSSKRSVARGPGSTGCSIGSGFVQPVEDFVDVLAADFFLAMPRPYPRTHYPVERSMDSAALRLMSAC